MYSRSNRSRASCSGSPVPAPGSPIVEHRAVEERQVGGADGVTGHHDHQALDHVAKLAHVSRPAIALKPRLGRSLEPFGPTAVLGGQLRHEVIGEERDVVGPIAQRRHEDRDHVQAEVQVLAKPGRANLRSQVFVGGSEHADVHPDAGRATDRLDDLLLQRPQHLGLRLQAHVADFVEEQRAAVGELELPAAIGNRHR